MSISVLVSPFCPSSCEGRVHHTVDDRLVNQDIATDQIERSRSAGLIAASTAVILRDQQFGMCLYFRADAFEGEGGRVGGGDGSPKGEEKELKSM